MLMPNSQPSSCLMLYVSLPVPPPRWETCSTDSELPEVVPRKSTKHKAARRPMHPSAAAAAAAHHSNTTAAAAAAAVAEATTAGAAAAADTAEVSSRAGAGGGAPDRGAAVGRSEGGASRPPMLGSTPVCTQTRYSYLSSDGIWRSRHDGLLNLGIIILVAANFRWAAGAHDGCRCGAVCRALSVVAVVLHVSRLP